MVNTFSILYEYTNSNRLFSLGLVYFDNSQSSLLLNSMTLRSLRRFSLTTLMMQEKGIQLSVVLFLSYDNCCANGCTAVNKQ